MNSTNVAATKTELTTRIVSSCVFTIHVNFLIFIFSLKRGNIQLRETNGGVLDFCKLSASARLLCVLRAKYYIRKNK